MMQFERRAKKWVTHGGGRRRGLVRLALWVAAIVILTNTVVFSSASFTSSSTNPGNVFNGGTLLLLNSGDGQLIVSALALCPGQSRQATLTLTNAGTVQGDVTVEGVGLSDVPATPALSSVLTLTFTDVASGTDLWSGTMGALTTAPLDTLAPGASREYRVTVAYPAGATDPALQGAQTALTLRFSGVSL
jgi:hypothetical protein